MSKRNAPAPFVNAQRLVTCPELEWEEFLQAFHWKLNYDGACVATVLGGSTGNYWTVRTADFLGSKQLLCSSADAGKRWAERLVKSALKLDGEESR